MTDISPQKPLSVEDSIAFMLDDSGLYPYPEFVRLFTSIFKNEATKEECDRAEKLIACGMNRKKIAVHFDNLYKKFDVPIEQRTKAAEIIGGMRNGF